VAPEADRVRRYRVRRASSPPPLPGDSTRPPWDRAEAAAVGHFHAAGSDHRPRAEARLLFDDRALYVLFEVDDRYVRAVAQGFQGPVYEDSCVELFIRPRPGKGYFNVETNCGGTLLMYYIEDPRRTADGFARYRRLQPRDVEGLHIFHSLPSRVEPEIADPLRWSVSYGLPLELLERYLGEPVRPGAGSWRGNFHKCGDRTSHPHWGSWSPIGEDLNFHQPERFGELDFDP
jgi:hypothetical protein